MTHGDKDKAKKTASKASGKTSGKTVEARKSGKEGGLKASQSGKKGSGSPAKNGEAGRALGAALMSSLVGALIGAGVLVADHRVLPVPSERRRVVELDQWVLLNGDGLGLCGVRDVGDHEGAEEPEAVAAE